LGRCIWARFGGPDHFLLGGKKMQFKPFLVEQVGKVTDNPRGMGDYVSKKGVFARKAGDFEEVEKTGSISRSELNKHFPITMKKLPTFTSNQLWTGDFKLWDKMSKKTPQFFVLVHERKKYLVDTQGYDYARYVTRLK